VSRPDDKIPAPPPDGCLDVDVAVVGAGVSGLGLVSFLKSEAARRGRPPPRTVVIERDRTPGGYCKTVRQDGFVWDYAGHFFHFRHKELEEHLVRRMGEDAVVRVQKRARVVDVCGHEVAFPYQHALAGLPRDALLACLGDLWRAEQRKNTTPPPGLEAALRHRLGDALCDRFLVPYNEKLYATSLDALDPGCMGRFFPTTTFDTVMDHLARPDVDPGAGSYNATFTYPRAGAIAYIEALLQDVADGELLLGEAVTDIDVTARTATTTTTSTSAPGTGRRVRYRHLVTSAPLPATLKACALPFHDGAFAHSRVLVFNLGFDKKGRSDAHWIYFAARDLPFYRVGFYDNILGEDRMSLYVEVGLPADGTSIDVAAWRARVLDGLRLAGVVTDQTLTSHHHVVLDPAYVHITQAAQAEAARLVPGLLSAGVWPVGRYGGWTYCSIEDNLVEAKALAPRLLDLLDLLG
jgi:protoporphyrinogen oxidase